MTKLETLQLKLTATRVRMGVIEATHGAGCGHPGGSLSAADVLTYLYFREMRIDPEQPQDPNRDRFVLSKGHCAPGLYATLAERGFFPVADLPTLRHSNSYLQGHPNMNTVPGVDMSTGSLGQGVSAACGMALGAKKLGSDINVYTLLGDGEIEEGECWEAFMFANHYKPRQRQAHLLPAAHDQGSGRQLHGKRRRLARQGPQRRRIRPGYDRAARRPRHAGKGDRVQQWLILKKLLPVSATATRW